MHGRECAHEFFAYALYRLIHLSTYSAERVRIDRKEKSEADMMEPLQYCIDDLTVNWFLTNHIAAANAHNINLTLLHSVQLITRQKILDA